MSERSSLRDVVAKHLGNLEDSPRLRCGGRGVAGSSQGASGDKTRSEHVTANRSAATGPKPIPTSQTRAAYAEPKPQTPNDPASIQQDAEPVRASAAGL